jgi:hypothetical protein
MKLWETINKYKRALWIAVIAIVTLIWIKSSNEIWQYLFYLRVPILAGLFLIMFPVIALGPLKAVFRNLFVLGGKWQLAFVIINAVMAGMAVTLVSLAILYSSPARFHFDASYQFKIPELYQYISAILLSLPVCCTAIYLSREELPFKKTSSGTIFGFFVSIVLLFLGNSVNRFFEQALLTSSSVKSSLISFINWVNKNEPAGYLNNQEISPIHITGVAFLLTAFLAYIAMFFLFKPRQEKDSFEAPALLYLMLIVSIFTLLVGGASFYLDYYRIPILTTLLLSFAINYWVFDVDNYFNLIKPQESDLTNKDIDKELKDFTKAIEKRLEYQLEYQDANQRSLVLVCMSGGGIQAAGWLVQVLAGLQNSLGEKFIKAIGTISSVSGGSVGTMYYLDRFNEKGYPDNNELKGIFDSATADSLDSIGWGLAYPDLWRIISMPWLTNILPKKLQDRGTAMEIDWQGQMKNPKATLTTWRNQIRTGQIPIPIFNATLVEDGRRFLISPMTFCENLKDTDSKIDFNTLYPGCDLNVVTAARLSATFPYVSPIARNKDKNYQNGKEMNYHIADGGYFDNSGVVTTVEWLDKWLDSIDKDFNLKNVLILQINAFPESQPQNESKADNGWWMTTIGPLLTLYSVRDTTQISRTATTIDFLKDKWEPKVDGEHKVHIEHISIPFPSLLKSDPQPLSWKLSKKQKTQIKKGWDDIKDEVVKNIKQKCECWGIVD